MPNYFFLRYPGGKAKALTFSYDDGVDQDIRLVEIFNKYGLKGTFNLNSSQYTPEGTVFEPGVVQRRMTEKQVTELFADGVHEVACHGEYHSYLDSLPTSGIILDILNDRMHLEKQFGRIVRGMAYPYGVRNADTIACLKQCGIAYCRATGSSEKFDMPNNWFELAPTCHHNNPKLMSLAQKFVEYNKRRPLLFFVWGHSYEFEMKQNWYTMERFAEYISGREDIWYATNIEIYDYVRDFGRLEYSADMKRVYNPTARTIWFASHFTDGEPISIGSGETLTF